MSSIAVDAGDGNDYILSGSLSVPVAISGGAGEDTLGGGTGADALRGGAGDDSLTGDEGSDVLAGDEGDDTIMPGGGTDTINGGSGSNDSVFYFNVPNASVTLDGQANDGPAGKNDSVGGDIENVYVWLLAGGAATIVGNDQANALTVHGGPGDITGGGGIDWITGDTSNDVIHARDNTFDRITCDDGADVVEADAVDSADSACEQVLLPPPPPPVVVPPPDRDADGITDGADRCPALSGPSARSGCPTGLSVDPSIAYERRKHGIRVLGYYVAATKGARITVTCSRGCRSTTTTGRGTRRVKITRLSNRTLRDGATITVRVSAPGRLTTSVVDRISSSRRREGRPTCSLPATTKPVLAC